MKTLKDLISDHPIFAGMNDKHLDIIASGAGKATFEPGQILIQEGEPAGQFFLIKSGRVSLEAHEPANGTAEIEILGPGDVLGWSWLFPPFTWHFRARALEPTETVVLNGGHVLVAAEEDKAFGYEIMKRVADVLIHRLQATRRRLGAQQIEEALHG
jgi:CRP-like cAMP-binding protein